MFIEAWLFVLIVLTWFVIVLVSCVGWMREENRRENDRDLYEEKLERLQETNGLLTRQMLQYRRALNFEEANKFDAEVTGK